MKKTKILKAWAVMAGEKLMDILFYSGMRARREIDVYKWGIKSIKTADSENECNLIMKEVNDAIKIIN